jgi:hypothetical protein
MFLPIFINVKSFKAARKNKILVLANIAVLNNKLPFQKLSETEFGYDDRLLFCG